MRTIITTLIALALAGAGAVYYAKYSAARSVVGYRTAAIARGDLHSTIDATGTIEPEEVVDVGARVMGLITDFGADPNDPHKLIDYCSVVENGTVLAKIDPTPYEAALDQAAATLERSKADQLQLEAKLQQAEQQWRRAEHLRPLKAIADSDYDAIVADYKAAQANLAVGQAVIRQSEAALRVAQINLGYTTITSPVRGEIIDRRVNIGQTVVASLNAPSLFLIAKDLRRMQVWASVNEADIGQIRVGMPVRFTVDAFPDEVFRGQVAQVRWNATISQNVVTYTVVVAADNSDRKLLPYLTANVQFELDQRSDVLLVPNAALRWEPRSAQIDPTAGPSALAAAETTGAEELGRLWVVAADGLVRPIEVVVGMSDGVQTEISGGNVKEGMQVVLGERETNQQESDEASGDSDNMSNPFLPKPPKGVRPPPGPM